MKNSDSFSKSSLNCFRLPVTCRCKAAHRSVIKKVEVVVRTKEKTKPGLTFKTGSPDVVRMKTGKVKIVEQASGKVVDSREISHKVSQA